MSFGTAPSHATAMVLKEAGCPLLVLLRVLTIDETTETRYFSCNTSVSLGTAASLVTVLILERYQWYINISELGYCDHTCQRLDVPISGTSPEN